MSQAGENLGPPLAATPGGVALIVSTLAQTCEIFDIPVTSVVRGPNAGIYETLSIQPLFKRRFPFATMILLKFGRTRVSLTLMKTCPICQQAYSDDVEFCARDGARLAAEVREERECPHCAERILKKARV